MLATPPQQASSPAVAVQLTSITPVRVFNSAGEYFDTELHIDAPLELLQLAIEDFFLVKPETQLLLHNRQTLNPKLSLRRNGCLMLKGDPFVKISFQLKRGPLLNLVCHLSSTHEMFPVACYEDWTVWEAKEALSNEIERKRRARTDAAGEAAPPPGVAVAPTAGRMRLLYRYMELNDRATLEYYRIPTNATLYIMLKSNGAETAPPGQASAARQKRSSSSGSGRSSPVSTRRGSSGGRSPARARSSRYANPTASADAALVHPPTKVHFLLPGTTSVHQTGGGQQPVWLDDRGPQQQPPPPPPQQQQEPNYRRVQPLPGSGAAYPHGAYMYPQAADRSANHAFLASQQQAQQQQLYDLQQQLVEARRGGAFPGGAVPPPLPSGQPLSSSGLHSPHGYAYPVAGQSPQKLSSGAMVPPPSPPPPPPLPAPPGQGGVPSTGSAPVPHVQLPSPGAGGLAGNTPQVQFVSPPLGPPVVPGVGVPSAAGPSVALPPPLSATGAARGQWNETQQQQQLVNELQRNIAQVQAELANAQQQQQSSQRVGPPPLPTPPVGLPSTRSPTALLSVEHATYTIQRIQELEESVGRLYGLLERTVGLIS
eukprot:gene11764-8091_t